MQNDISSQVIKIQGQVNDFYTLAKKIISSLYDRNLELVKRNIELESELRKYKHE